MKRIQTRRMKKKGKWGGGAFVDPNHPASVIVLVVNIASKTLIRPLSWRHRQRCPRCSNLHLKAETEQKAIPRQSVLAAPPQWILGQVAEQRESLGCQDFKHCRAAGFFDAGK